MHITKTNLQTISKLLNISTIGTKHILQTRICTTLKNIETPSTLRALIKKKSPLAFNIAKDIHEMLDDDSEIASIVKTLTKLYKVTINKTDVIVFAELLDALQKRDYLYIEEKLEKEAKYGFELLKLYKPNDVKLHEI